MTAGAMVSSSGSSAVYPVQNQALAAPIRGYGAFQATSARVSPV